MSVQLLLAQLYLYYNQLSPTKTRKTGKKKNYFLATPLPHKKQKNRQKKKNPISWQHLTNEP